MIWNVFWVPVGRTLRLPGFEFRFVKTVKYFGPPPAIVFHNVLSANGLALLRLCRRVQYECQLILGPDGREGLPLFLKFYIRRRW